MLRFTRSNEVIAPLISIGQRAGFKAEAPRRLHSGVRRSGQRVNFTAGYHSE
jgi:hypothetical protein